MMRASLLVILLGISLSATAGGAGRTLTVAAYNLCNLFDTINDPGIADDVPTPEAYRFKIEALARVIGELGADVVGLCEVENAAVLHDLIAAVPLDGDVSYRFVHYESPDRRGIDVALLYRADRLRPVASEPIRAPESYPTRDVLRAEFAMDGTDRRLVFYVLHLPSRRGGHGQADRMRQMIAASVGELVAGEASGTGVVVLGDLNDIPTAGWMRRTLAAEETGLRNLTVAPHRRGVGSYAWRDAWLMYDHILVNGDVNPIGEVRVFRRPWMLTPSGRFRGYPDRRISDHLPVYVRVAY
ncbi:MAG: endonuclease/exonuclease/phosphatase family protein [Rikenella sp.]|nr:endonuclease/exonuclease/phosphatase family protein [Rikenella sp.]